MRLPLLALVLATGTACDVIASAGEIHTGGGRWNLATYEIVVAENGAELYREAAEDAGFFHFRNLDELDGTPHETAWDEEFDCRRPEAVHTSEGWSGVTRDAWGRYSTPNGELHLTFSFDFGANPEIVVFSEESGDRLVGQSVVTGYTADVAHTITRSYTLEKEVE